jgi:hypothetical protein
LGWRLSILAISAIDIAFILLISEKKINNLGEFVYRIIDKYGTIMYRIIIRWLPMA